MEINVTDKVEASEERPEEKELPVGAGEDENAAKPEVAEEKMETELTDEKEDVEMEVDEKVEEKNDTEEAGQADVVEESKGEEITEVSGSFYNRQSTF